MIPTSHMSRPLWEAFHLLASHSILELAIVYAAPPRRHQSPVAYIKRQTRQNGCDMKGRSRQDANAPPWHSANDHTAHPFRRDGSSICNRSVGPLGWGDAFGGCYLCSCLREHQPSSSKWLWYGNNLIPTTSVRFGFRPLLVTALSVIRDSHIFTAVLWALPNSIFTPTVMTHPHSGHRLLSPLFADGHSGDVNCSSKLAVIDIVCKKSITDHAITSNRTRTPSTGPGWLTTTLWLRFSAPHPSRKEDTTGA